MNDAEEFVYQVCKKTFLSLWSYANPIGKKPNKELCDILVIYEPNIIIFSVKDVRISATNDISVKWRRWQQRAIKDSVKQIYGAERFIKTCKTYTHVIRRDGTAGLPLPEEADRRIYRIAVALGSQGEVPILSGYLGEGFVHVLDNEDFFIVLNELDTISDFVSYLNDKEDFCAKTQIIAASEKALLALYLSSEHSFPKDATLIHIDNTLWDGFKNEETYKRKRIADKESRVWDNLIEIYCKDILDENLEFSVSLMEAEIAIRTMARENRLYRRLLGKAFWEFFQLSNQAHRRLRSRMVKSELGTVYVFLVTPHSQSREMRKEELANRCFVARGLNQDCDKVVGIATESYEPGKGFSLDLIYLNIENWTDENQNTMESIQQIFGYFTSAIENLVHEDEYPKTI